MQHFTCFDLANISFGARVFHPPKMFWLHQCTMYAIDFPVKTPSYDNQSQICVALSNTIPITSTYGGESKTRESSNLSAIAVYYAVTMTLTRTCIPRTSAVHYSPSLWPP